MAFTSREDGALAASFFERTDVSEADIESHATAVPLSKVYEVVDEARRRVLFWSNLAARLEARAQRRRRRPVQPAAALAVACRSTGSSIDRRHRPRPYRDLTSAASLDR